jgi:hypothetical protein
MTSRMTAPAVLAWAVVLVCGGCRGDREGEPPRQFFPDMDDSPKWKPQSGSDFYADGRTMRQPVAGTVAFGRLPLVSGEDWAAEFMAGRDDLLREDSEYFTGRSGTRPDGKPLWVERIPEPVTEGLLRRGQERFGIYCAVCHGLEGDGKGAVAARWAAPVPSFHDPKYRDPNEPDGKGRDGFLFFTALHGVVGPDGSAKMPGYAHALSERDVWAIVSYIRALERSRLGSPADIPAEERPRLDQERSRLIERAKAEAAKGAAGGAK